VGGRDGKVVVLEPVARFMDFYEKIIADNEPDR
jgi:hypothetical protein